VAHLRRRSEVGRVPGDEGLAGAQVGVAARQPRQLRRHPRHPPLRTQGRPPPPHTHPPAPRPTARPATPAGCRCSRQSSSRPAGGGGEWGRTSMPDLASAKVQADLGYGTTAQQERHRSGRPPQAV
jgi:hypothetical protein